MSTIKTTNITHASNSGTANMVLADDGKVTFASPVGLFSSYAIIADEKSSGTDGGTFTLGAWRTRDLNTEIADPDGIVSISSNQFTLQAGTYLVKASAPAYRVVRHQIKLYNATDSTDIARGTSEQSHISYLTQNRSFLFARFTLSAAKALEIQHYSSHTHATEGFGYAAENGLGEQYTVVEIYKEA